ncbi:MAG: hypothetical protein ACI85I_000912 [Arenicella sp.]|jgi:hypothetical protein
MKNLKIILSLFIPDNQVLKHFFGIQKGIKLFRYSKIIASILPLAFYSCEIIDSPIQIVDTSTQYEETTDVATGNPALKVADFGQGTGTVTWKADKAIILEGFVYVNSGQTLTIEPGTVIKGTTGQDTKASALIVARGGKIMATGTANKPIIFTALSDNLNGNLSSNDRGLWGGLIVLGSARLNSAPGVSGIEGIPANEPRGVYGGSDDEDNSGILKYISIRHGGTEIGEGNEINGFTLAGVGSATSINYIEIFANKDDGIEFFGGTAQLKYLVSAYCADDGIDYDEGYRGNIQFGLIYQDENLAGHGGEHDGGTSPQDDTPFANPTLCNITSIGSRLSGDRGILFKENAGGKYYNSLFHNYTDMISIELLQAGEHSFARLQAGDLEIKNNVFWQFPSQIAEISIGSGVTATARLSAETFLANYISTNNNQLLDLGVSRSNVIPTPHNLVLSQVPNFFDQVDFVGAFDPNEPAWFEGWSKIGEEL